MRITVVTNLYPPDVLGGYELLAHDVVTRLRARGHEVDVLSANAGPSPTQGGEEGVWRTLALTSPFEVPVGRERARHVWMAMENAGAVRAYLEARGTPDVVLAMSQRRLGLEPLRTFAQAGVPIVATVNDDWPVAYARGEVRGVRAAVGRVLDWTVARSATWAGVPVRGAVWLSDAVRRTVLAAGAPLPEGRVCPQGVDRERFPARAPRAVPRAPSLLFVGRLHPSKAPEVAIDALAELVARGLDPSLTMVGATSDPSYARALEAHAEARGVGERVRWLGFRGRSELPEIYRAADVCLFATRLEHEGQGLTWVEALASGVPVVASPSGGAREHLAHDPAAALLAQRCDGRAFADEIERLVADPGLVSALHGRGLAMVEEVASLEGYVDSLAAELAAAVFSSARAA